MSKIEELKQEASELGIKYAKNIGEDALQSKIEDFKASQTADDLDEVQETVEPVAPVRPKSIKSLARQIWADAKKTRIVRITSNDKRDNHVTTTAYLSVENEFGGLSKIVPLDEKVELEQCLIDRAKEDLIPQHVEEVIEGKRTGNKTVKMIRKYSVSYED